jgi:hypothetical protein
MCTSVDHGTEDEIVRSQQSSYSGPLVETRLVDRRDCVLGGAPEHRQVAEPAEVEPCRAAATSAAAREDEREEDGG